MILLIINLEADKSCSHVKAFNFCTGLKKLEFGFFNIIISAGSNFVVNHRWVKSSHRKGCWLIRESELSFLQNFKTMFAFFLKPNCTIFKSFTWGIPVLQQSLVFHIYLCGIYFMIFSVSVIRKKKPPNKPNNTNLLAKWRLKRRLMVAANSLVQGVLNWLLKLYLGNNRSTKQTGFWDKWT